MGFRGYFTVPQNHYVVHTEFSVFQAQDKIKELSGGNTQFLRR
jgi:hypothetical protein